MLGELYDFELEVYESLEGRLSNIPEESARKKYIENIAKAIRPSATAEQIKKVVVLSAKFSNLTST